MPHANAKGRHRAPTRAQRLSAQVRTQAVPAGAAVALSAVAASAALIGTGGDDPAEAVAVSQGESTGDVAVTAARRPDRGADRDADSVSEQAAARRLAAATVSRSSVRTGRGGAAGSHRRAGSKQGGEKLGGDKLTRSVRSPAARSPAVRSPAVRSPAVSDPRDIARSQLGDYGWDRTEYACLDQLWIGESGWDHTATNPTSGAYGIPQSLPANKMASAGRDWRTNPATQIAWGLEYISLSYGTPCAANDFKVANNWY